MSDFGQIAMVFLFGLLIGMVFSDYRWKTKAVNIGVIKKVSNDKKQVYEYNWVVGTNLVKVR